MNTFIFLTYVEELFYDGVCKIVLVAFNVVEHRDEFLLNKYAAESTDVEELWVVVHVDAMHYRYDLGEGENQNTVNYCTFESGGVYYLFLTCIDSDSYYGYDKYDKEYWHSLVETWVDSLEVFEV